MWYPYVASVSKLHKCKSDYISAFILRGFILLFVSCGKLIPIAIMYATWSGLGIFTLALVSYFAFNQTLNFLSVIGLALIIIGVILVNINLSLSK